MQQARKGFAEMGPEEVRERYGIGPEQVPDFIALRGDPSDGLPGAKGIGAKTAADILQRKGDLEHAILGAIREKPSVRRALIEQADELRSFKDIATLREVELDAAAGPRDRLGRRRGGGARARHEPARGAAGEAGLAPARQQAAWLGPQARAKRAPSSAPAVARRGRRGTPRPARRAGRGSSIPTS